MLSLAPTRLLPLGAPGVEVREGRVRVRGRVVAGLGVGGRFVSDPYYSLAFSRLLGCTPYPGTLNIESDTDWRELASTCRPMVVGGVEGRGVVYVWMARLAGERVLLIRPLKSSHEPWVLEVVACRRLRGDVPGEVVVEVDCVLEPPYTRPPRLLRELP